jgi:hypothetical protein
MEMCEGIHFNNIRYIFVETMYNPKLGAARQLFWVVIASCVRQGGCLICHWWCQQKPQQTPHAVTFSL